MEASQPDPLAPISVNSNGLRPGERFDFLNDIYSKERLVLAPRRPIGTSISAGTTLWEVGDLRYALTFSSGHLGRRVRDRTSAVLALRQHHTGGCHSWSDDGYFVTRPGDILVTLNTVDGLHACQDLETTNIAIPVDLLDIDFTSFGTTKVLPAGTLGNRLLSAGIDTWTTALRSSTLDNVPQMESEIVSLCNHVLAYCGPETEDDATAAARAAAIRKYIDDNALGEDLSIDRICKLFGASRASVYRAFAQEGGVHRYALKVRLRRGLFMLSSMPSERGAVSAVAARLGYDDPSQFSKAFRAQFGFSPTDALALSGRDADRTQAGD